MGTILNGFRCALAIISGIVILICSSAKPAGLAELPFHGSGVVKASGSPFCENSVWSTPQSAANAK